MSDKQVYTYAPGIVCVGSNDAKQVIVSALDTLKENSPTAKELIETVSGQCAKDNLILQIYRGPFRNPCNCASCKGQGSLMLNQFMPHDGSIIFTPEYDMYDASEPWMVPPKEIYLAHELVHVHHMLRGDNYSDNITEEYKTVGLFPWDNEKFSENAIRRDYGVPLRPKY